jgi:DNA-binding NarL/FixJ family response regulator
MTATKVLRVLVLEDTYLELQGIERVLHAALRSEPHDIQSVRVVPEAMALVETWRPDFIVADGEIYTDKLAGAEFVRFARGVLPEAKIMGLTRYPECYEPLRAAGCDHVINKSVLDSPGAVEQHLRATFLARPRPRPRPAPPRVSPEAARVLRRLARGLTERQIAAELALTQRQVKHLKDNLFNLFGAANDNELVHLAHATGLLSADDDLTDPP